MLNETIKAVNKAGFRFSLFEDGRAWSAFALADTVGAGGLYTRAVGIGKTPDEAMQKLTHALTAPAESFDDLV